MLLRCWVFVGMAIIAPSQTLTTTLVNFNGTNGGSPNGPLLQASDGNFYGTAESGGAHSGGAVFKITPSGNLTTLYSFSGTDVGVSPTGGLIQASDGNFYGTTAGGTNVGGVGTIFKVTPAGTVTFLHRFNGNDGSAPEGGLVQGSDGSLYGTTSQGGASSQGTIFKITPAGSLTTLHSFSGMDGASPYAGLIQASDGNFYGTTGRGGTRGIGTVFQITPGGTLTTLYSFTGGNDSSAPRGSLVQATDGSLYGTTSLGGPNVGSGTIFKITPSGTLTFLYTFHGPDGSGPFAGLIQASDGNFYGTTQGGGTDGDGTVFEITPSGMFTTLHSFLGGTDGYNPLSVPIEGSDGNLYGTTNGTPGSSFGTVFRLQTMLPANSGAPTITLVQNAEGGAPTIAPNSWVTLKGSNLAPAGDSRIWQTSDFVNNELPTQLDGVSVTLNGEKAYVYYISPTQINILTPPDLATGTVQVQAATNAGPSASFAAQAQAESPSFFIIGAGPYVVATHADGSLIGPASLYPGQTTPAQPGETIVLYANGFGPAETPVVSGSETQSGGLIPLPVITIGGTPSTVQFAGLISPGLFQFNVVVPASTPSGDNALAATYGGLTTQSGVLVTVGP
jgi:uncharacterized protein (TIGR03437 family)